MESSSSAGPPTLKDASKAVVDQLPADPLKEHLLTLRAEQTRIKAERKAVAKAVKVAQRKQQRLRQRTRLMSSEDLVAALLMRKEAAEKRAASQSAAAPVPTEGTSQSSGTKGKLAVPTGAATKEADAASSSGPSVQLPPPEAQDMEIDREPEASEADRDGDASMEE